MNTLKSILNQAGQSLEKCSNRNPLYKELNNQIGANLLQVEVASFGCELVTANGRSADVILKAGGKRQLFRMKSRFGFVSVSFIGHCAAAFLSDDQVKECIKEKYASEALDEKCSKCQGSGFLPMFKHICNGVCFGCMGTGFKLNYK